MITLYRFYYNAYNFYKFTLIYINKIVLMNKVTNLDKNL